MNFQVKHGIYVYIVIRTGEDGVPKNVCKFDLVRK